MCLAVRMHVWVGRLWCCAVRCSVSRFTVFLDSPSGGGSGVAVVVVIGIAEGYAHSRMFPAAGSGREQAGVSVRVSVRCGARARECSERERECWSARTRIPRRQSHLALHQPMRAGGAGLDLWARV